MKGNAPSVCGIFWAKKDRKQVTNASFKNLYLLKFSTYLKTFSKRKHSELFCRSSKNTPRIVAGFKSFKFMKKKQFCFKDLNFTGLTFSLKISKLLILYRHKCLK